MSGGVSVSGHATACVACDGDNDALETDCQESAPKVERRMKYARHDVFPIMLVVLVLVAILFCIPAAFSAQVPSFSALYAISRAIGVDQKGYHFHLTKRGASLKNSSQDFTAMLTDDVGLKIRRQGHHVTMHLASVGSGKTILNPQVVGIKQKANRIVYDQGLLKQWFVNGPMGLQQGFTIHKRPGKDRTGKLVLTLNVNSDLQPRAAVGSRGVEFVTTDEDVVLQYTGLMVVDADTRQLPAHIETHRNQIDIVVDDRKAMYPVIVDPIFQQAKLTASDGTGGADQAGDWFGYSIAVDGNTIVVGAPEHDEKIDASTYHIYQGTAYIFEKRAGHWTEIRRLKASGGKSYERFGKSVAIDKDVIVVGTPHAGAQGCAYVFVKSPNGWPIVETAKLTSWYGGANDWFGYSVAIEGDTVVVGSMQHDVSGKTDQGEASVFVKPAGGWIDMTKESCTLRASDGKADEFFGRSVAISNNTIIVGSDAHGTGGSTCQGAVYVYEKPSTGWVTHTVLTEQAKLMASDGDEYDHLGHSVAIDGNTIVAGAPGFHVTGKANLGAVYVFVKSGTHWINMEETAEFRATDGMEDDNFGYAVAIDGNTIVVGSPYHNRTDKDPTGLPYYIPDMGAVYTFSVPSGGWHDLQTKAAMISDDGQANDHLGKSVAISSPTIVAGAPDQDLSGKTDQGAAYVFHYKNKNPWPMFISAVTSHVGHVVAGNKKAGHPTSGDTSTHRLFLGSLDIDLTNKTLPHFFEMAESFCYILMPVVSDSGQLFCSTANLRYDATEDNGATRIRRIGSIVFSPIGTCSRSQHSCTVNPTGNGSETIWQWYWNGSSWSLVPGMPVTMPIDWRYNKIYFKNMNLIDGGCDSVKTSTATGEVEWTLCLVHRP